MNSILRQARRLIIFIVGTTVLLIGVALLVLPGPAFVVIPLGLAILATEFLWARWLLKRLKKEAQAAGRAAGNFWKNGVKTRSDHCASNGQPSDDQQRMLSRK